MAIFGMVFLHAASRDYCRRIMGCNIPTGNTFIYANGTHFEINHP